MHQKSYRLKIAVFFVAISVLCATQPTVSQKADANPLLPQTERLVTFHHGESANSFALAENGRVAPIYVDAENPEAVKLAAAAFAGDLQSVTGLRAQLLTALTATPPRSLVIAGVVGRSAVIDHLRSEGKLQTQAIEGKWESAITAVVDKPIPGVQRALVIAGSDRRSVAFALFTLSRQMGVSPWAWWADVPVQRHSAVFVSVGSHLQAEPSVQYRGIFLNDEDWGLRPWASKKMDPSLNNIGPNTYARIFELLLRLHANSLWPGMHPGTLAFNALPENALLADRWGIVMGTSHSEAMLRNNVGEWNEKRDGPWNYQLNRAAIDAYWEKRVAVNGGYENFYTVGMRGLHDSGLEAAGTAVEKARLVESAMAEQRELLRKHLKTNLRSIPQVIWLYKESLDLYRAGMQVPDDVTLGWADDNYGYIRQLPTAAEQKRSGGSGVYYHVSYWGEPHDYLWLCTTQPALIREEMTKAYDHHARRYWILNVGDLKPAEMDIDYFLQLAWDEPRSSQVDQRAFIENWSAEQFPRSVAPAIARLMEQYYQLNFARKPEFMGFNGYNDRVKRTDFNPLAWGDQNRTRAEAWQRLSDEAAALAQQLPAAYQDAYFELVAYPVEAAAAQNLKFLETDRSYLDATHGDGDAMRLDSDRAHAAYHRIQSLTMRYNSLANGKWEGMMSAEPRDRDVFNMPVTAYTPYAHDIVLPASWNAFTGSTAITPPAEAGKPSAFIEQYATVSINAAHFARKQDGENAAWKVDSSLGITGASVEYGSPGLLATPDSVAPPMATAPWLEYDFQTVSSGDATLSLYLLPAFPVDAQHKLRYAVALDGRPPVLLDASGSGEWQEKTSQTWAANVLSNFAVTKLALGQLAAGDHTLRLIYQDPGVVFEHIVVTFPGAPSGYPTPPETLAR